MSELRLSSLASIRKDGGNSTHLLALIFGSLTALAGTYVWAASAVEVGTRANGFGAIVTLYLGASLLFYIWQWRGHVAARIKIRDAEIERSLAELQDANELIAGSLRLVDVYRLIAHHVHPLLGCVSSCLITLDDSRRQLRTVAAIGSVPADLYGRELNEGSLSSACFAMRKIVTSQAVDPRAEGLVATGSTPLGSAALPLFRGSEVIAVMQFFFTRRSGIIDARIPLLDAMGTRLSSMVVSSIIFERNNTRAMSDPITELPNYGAFLDVLEDHIAETTRFSDRSLSVLCIDVKRFEEINSERGHGVGDAVLEFVASTVSETLRTLDLIARNRDDEFLVVLPSASEEMAKTIIMRIEDAFRGSRLEIAGFSPLKVELNIGWAVYGRDGDYAQSLIARARIRKDKTKTSSTPGRVVLFPGV